MLFRPKFALLAVRHLKRLASYKRISDLVSQSCAWHIWYTEQSQLDTCSNFHHCQLWVRRCRYPMPSDNRESRTRLCTRYRNYFSLPPLCRIGHPNGRCWLHWSCYHTLLWQYDSQIHHSRVVLCRDCGEDEARVDRMQNSWSQGKFKFIILLRTSLISHSLSLINSLRQDQHPLLVECVDSSRVWIRHCHNGIYWRESSIEKGFGVDVGFC